MLLSLGNAISDGKPIGVNIMEDGAKGLAGGVAAVFCCIIGTAMLLHYFRQRRRCKAPVEAEIMRNDKSAGKNGTLYAPEYSYHYDGKHYSFQSSAYTRDAYEVGQKVTVYIDPKAPEICIDRQKVSRVRLWTGLFFELLAVIGAVLFFTLFQR